jgi:hypothetical protein
MPMDITTYDLNSLAAKLDALDPTATEKQILDGIIGIVEKAQADVEVVGFSDIEVRRRPLPDRDPARPGPLGVPGLPPLDGRPRLGVP